MTIADEIAEAKASQKLPGVQCSVCVWLADRPDRDDINRAITVFGPRAAHVTLTKHGYVGAESSIKRHRLGSHK